MCCGARLGWAGAHVFSAPCPAGIHSLLDKEAEAVGGACHSHATKDLCVPAVLCSLMLAADSLSCCGPCCCRYEAVAAGDYPEWTLCIQAMDPKDEDKYVSLQQRSAWARAQ